MPNPVRGRNRTPGLKLNDEDDRPSSPSYFEWRERTIRTKAYRPVAKPQPKANSLVRLLRRLVQSAP